MRPIWYFVGLLLTMIGVVVLVSGVYELVWPSERITVLGETHPSLWWGGVILVAGIIYLLTNRNKVVE